MINDVELVKQIWPNSKFCSKLKDKNDIPFFVAHNLFINNDFAGNSATDIDIMLNDDTARKHLEDTFGYSIKEYREDILKLSQKAPKLKGFEKFKQNIYSKPSKNLGLRDMAFLSLHRIYNLITLKKLREKFKEKNNKQYSL